MTTEKMPKETETTMKPLIMSSAEINEEENMVPQTTVTSQGNNSTMVNMVLHTYLVGSGFHAWCCTPINWVNRF